MKWRRRLAINGKQMMVLSYIHRYHRIDYLELKEELNIPVEEIANIVMQLHAQQLIVSADQQDRRNSLEVNSDRIKSILVDWDVLSQYYPEKKNFEDSSKDIQEEFAINELYIPEKFDTI